MSAIIRNVLLVVLLAAGFTRSLLRGMVDTVRGWGRKPKVEGEPYLVTEYPGKVSVGINALVSQGSHMFADACLGKWEQPLCDRLGGGEYRMELRFYRVEGGE